MKITKEYLRTVIKEELERLDESNYQAAGGARFDTMAIQAVQEYLQDGGTEDINSIGAKITSTLGRDKIITSDDGMKLRVTTPDNRTLKLYKNVDSAVRDLTHAMKVNTQNVKQPQQKPAQTTPAKLAPGSVMKSV